MRYVVDQESEYAVCHVQVFDETVEHVDHAISQVKAGRCPYMSAKDFQGYADIFEDKTFWLGRTDIKNWEDCARVISQPWEQGIQYCQEMREKLAQHTFKEPVSIKRRCQWQDSDGDFNFDRYADGQDAFRAPRRREVFAQQFITLLVDIGANCDTDAKKLMWRAAGAIAATEILEENGYGVEIIAVDSSNGCYHSINGIRQNMSLATWVKRPDQPLDIANVVNCVSPWYFRLISFASYAGANAQCTNGLGFHRSMPMEQIEKFVTTDPRMLYIHGAFNEREAVKLVNQVLEDFSKQGDRR